MKITKEILLKNKKKEITGDKEVIKMIEPPIKQDVYIPMLAYFNTMYLLNKIIERDEM